MFQKEYIIEEGQVYYRKKSLSRQPLFWAALLGWGFSLILFVICLLLSISLGTYISREEARVQLETEAEVSDYVFYKVGDQVEIYPDILFTVESLEVDPTISLVDESADQAVVVELTIENQSDDDFLFDEMEAAVTDLEGFYYYNIDDSTYETTIPTVKAGATEKIRLIYAVDEEEMYSFEYDFAVWEQE